MNHATAENEGPLEFPLKVTKATEGEGFVATCPYVPEKSWAGADEEAAIRHANEELRVLRQSRQLQRVPKWAAEFGARPYGSEQ